MFKRYAKVYWDIIKRGVKMDKKSAKILTALKEERKILLKRKKFLENRKDIIGYKEHIKDINYHLKWHNRYINEIKLGLVKY